MRQPPQGWTPPPPFNLQQGQVRYRSTPQYGWASEGWGNFQTSPPVSRFGALPIAGGYGEWLQRRQAGVVAPGQFGVSGGAPQAIHAGGVPRRIPTNPIDATSSAEARSDAYKRMQEHRIAMMADLSPYGRQIALQTPFEMGGHGRRPTEADAYYYPNVNRIRAWSTNPGLLRHEYGHAFGWAQDPSGVPQGFQNAAENDIVWGGFNGPAAPNFPGMFGNPQPPGVWGGPAEFYAHLNTAPAYIPPKLRPYFPQFSEQTFAPRPGWDWKYVTFEDGSQGWTYTPITNP